MYLGLWLHIYQRTLILDHQGWPPWYSSWGPWCWESFRLLAIAQCGRWGWSRCDNYYGSTPNRWYNCGCMTWWQCLHMSSKYEKVKSCWEHFLRR
jgi:hypothetical protein